MTFIFSPQKVREYDNKCEYSRCNRGHDNERFCSNHCYGMWRKHEKANEKGIQNGKS